MRRAAFGELRVLQQVEDQTEARQGILTVDKVGERGQKLLR
jgi:hypothetical protein